jgi:hypothetical protein
MSDVIDTGKLVCRSLRGGGSGLDAASGFNAAEARIVVRAALEHVPGRVTAVMHTRR